MDIHKQFTQGVGLIGIANALVSASGIVLLPLLTKNLPATGYGYYVQVVTTVALLSVPLTLGLPIVLVRFVALNKEQEHIKADFYSIMFVTVLMNIIASCVLLLLSRSVADFLFGGSVIIAAILPIIILFASFNLLLLDYFRAFTQIKRYSLFYVAQTYLGLAFTSFFIFAGYGTVGAVLGFLVGQVVVFAIMLSIVVANIGIGLPRFAQMRTYLSFSVPLIPGSLSFWVVNSSDRYLIGIFLGASYVAYYSPSYALGMIIIMFSMPIAMMLPAIMSKHFDDNELILVEKTLRYSSKYFLALAVPTTVFLSFFSKQINPLEAHFLKLKELCRFISKDFLLHLSASEIFLLSR